MLFFSPYPFCRVPASLRGHGARGARSHLAQGIVTILPPAFKTAFKREGTSCCRSFGRGEAQPEKACTTQHHGGSVDVRAFHGPLDSQEAPKRLHSTTMGVVLRSRGAGSKKPPWSLSRPIIMMRIKKRTNLFTLSDLDFSYTFSNHFPHRSQIFQCSAFES
jgi:hypothetical protein